MVNPSVLLEDQVSMELPLLAQARRASGRNRGGCWLSMKYVPKVKKIWISNIV